MKKLLVPTDFSDLTRAIDSVWRLDNDVDHDHVDRLEKCIDALEQVRTEILRDSTDMKEFSSAFERALNVLAQVELQVAEDLAEANHFDQADDALRFAKIHIKQAILFHDTDRDSKPQRLVTEQNVLTAIDGLDTKRTSYREYSTTLERMINEIGLVLELNEN